MRHFDVGYRQHHLNIGPRFVSLKTKKRQNAKQIKYLFVIRVNINFSKIKLITVNYDAMPGHAIRCGNRTQLVAPPQWCSFYVSIFASSTSIRNQSEEFETERKCK